MANSGAPAGRAAALTSFRARVGADVTPTGRLVAKQAEIKAADAKAQRKARLVDVRAKTFDTRTAIEYAPQTFQAKIVEGVFDVGASLESSLAGKFLIEKGAWVGGVFRDYAQHLREGKVPTSVSILAPSLPSKPIEGIIRPIDAYVSERVGSVLEAGIVSPVIVTKTAGAGVGITAIGAYETFTGVTPATAARREAAKADVWTTATTPEFYIESAMFAGALGVVPKVAKGVSGKIKAATEPTVVAKVAPKEIVQVTTTRIGKPAGVEFGVTGKGTVVVTEYPSILGRRIPTLKGRTTPFVAEAEVGGITLTKPKVVTPAKIGTVKGIKPRLVVTEAVSEVILKPKIEAQFVPSKVGKPPIIVEAPIRTTPVGGEVVVKAPKLPSEAGYSFPIKAPTLETTGLQIVTAEVARGKAFVQVTPDYLGTLKPMVKGMKPAVPVSEAVGVAEIGKGIAETKVKFQRLAQIDKTQFFEIYGKQGKITIKGLDEVKQQIKGMPEKPLPETVVYPKGISPKDVTGVEIARQVPKIKYDIPTKAGKASEVQVQKIVDVSGEATKATTVATLKALEGLQKVGEVTVTKTKVGVVAPPITKPKMIDVRPTGITTQLIKAFGMEKVIAPTKAVPRPPTTIPAITTAAKVGITTRIKTPSLIPTVPKKPIIPPEAVPTIVPTVAPIPAGLPPAFGGILFPAVGLGKSTAGAAKKVRGNLRSALEVARRLMRKGGRK